MINRGKFEKKFFFEKYLLPQFSLNFIFFSSFKKKPKKFKIIGQGFLAALRNDSQLKNAKNPLLF